MYEISYKFKHEFNLSTKDIALGFNIYTYFEPVYGTYGRARGIEIHLLFLHFRLVLIRHGFKKRVRRTKSK